jgi:hypothetical protein
MRTGAFAGLAGNRSGAPNSITKLFALDSLQLNEMS